MGGPEPELPEREAAPEPPAFNEEYFEWIDLLEAVDAATNRFSMLELGAGWGRWSARAAAACRQRQLPCRLVAVEAEPTHFAWLLQNLDDNGVRLEDCRLVQAAVAGQDGTVGFHVGDPATWYGQCIGGTTQVPSISLATLLRDEPLVDLIDMDVQGTELEIVTAVPDLLAEKVKRVHIETHSGHVHAGVHRVFHGLGWKLHFSFEGNSMDTTPWGPIDFQGGTESWLNPRLCSQDELRNARTSRNSRAWRAAKAARRLVDRVAPPGTRRRGAVSATVDLLWSRYRRDPHETARRPSSW
ncbi:MAG: FkbM family methyltransferase [Vicinamibacterales bacterium]